MLLKNAMNYQEYYNDGEFEYGPHQHRKERMLAWRGALIGALVGGLLFGLIFYVPTLYIESPYKTLICLVGIFVGIIQGAGIGPLVALRISRGLHFGPRPKMARARIVRTSVRRSRRKSRRHLWEQQ